MAGCCCCPHLHLPPSFHAIFSSCHCCIFMMRIIFAASITTLLGVCAPQLRSALPTQDTVLLPYPPTTIHVSIGYVNAALPLLVREEEEPPSTGGILLPSPRSLPPPPRQGWQRRWQQQWGSIRTIINRTQRGEFHLDFSMEFDLDCLMDYSTEFHLDHLTEFGQQ